MVAKFPYMDAGTICKVSYPFYKGKSSRVEPFMSATGYTLTEEDYKTIWGGRGADYLTITSEPNIPAFLASKFPTATEGKITVAGLTAGTEYNFVITALDAAQNESENSKTVTVTTDTRVTVPTAAAPVPAWPAAQVKSLYFCARFFEQLQRGLVEQPEHDRRGYR